MPARNILGCYTKNMEQLPLDLNPEPEALLKSLPLSELLQIYKDKIGIPARTQDDDALIKAINDPEYELSRLREIDCQEDKQELAAHYKR